MSILDIAAGTLEDETVAHATPRLAVKSVLHIQVLQLCQTQILKRIVRGNSEKLISHITLYIETFGLPSLVAMNI